MMIDREKQQQALFAAILVDDEMDAVTELPLAADLDYQQDVLTECFALCHDLWRSGFEHGTLRLLTGRIIRCGDLGSDDRTTFKHIRAKFKHMRYAFELYSISGARPILFDRITITMGHIQDAYRNGRSLAVRREALLLRMLLGKPFVACLGREIGRAEMVTPEAFRSLIEYERKLLSEFLHKDTITGIELHRVRKLIGRRVSFYDTLRTLHPSPEAFKMSRWLSAINGLMGELHDELVERRAKQRDSYHVETFELPPAVRQRLGALISVPFR